VANCPPMYDGARVDGITFMVTPNYEDGHVQVDVLASITRGHLASFASWNMRVTSLADPKIQASIPLAFSAYCGDNFHSKYCPVALEPKTLAGPQGESPKTDSQFLARPNLPAEFTDGFLLELPEVFDGASKLEPKPLKFELRKHMLVRGTFGC
jgi:hypothetical protein